ncbi:MAG: undecaprenyl-phosphate glucose phosphotransferase, partial [Deltaproteobacteria bacterium]|nr:undecaprenyl-phosphate glucose phosphotransferase [Deltaproteobacteria bacterium]
MLKQHSRFFESLMLLMDFVFITVSWLFAYVFRFYGPIPVFHSLPPLMPYLWLLLAMLVFWSFAFRAFALYRPRRTSSKKQEIWDITKALSFSVLVLTGLTFFYRGFSFSRVMFMIFWITGVASLCLSRVLFRELLRLLSRRGYNVRRALVVGTSAIAQKVIDAVNMHPELGLQISGLLSERVDLVGRELKGIKVLGTYGEIQRITNEESIDQLFIALPLDQNYRLEGILTNVGDTMVDIKVIPDLHPYVRLRGGMEDFEGLPFINIQTSPLYGWSSFIKRLIDLSLGAIALILFSPLMAFAALAIKVTSRGPVLYRQERVGLDGKRFQMLKFRTMVDGEPSTGSAWTIPDDPRVTPIGRWLRRMSLDELPQIFNVLKGEMSLVGPRPEMSPLLDGFQKAIPKYMLRHKVKAGMTGWAQVNGWRGNTSLEKRIE